MLTWSQPSVSSTQRGSESDIVGPVQLQPHLGTYVKKAVQPLKASSEDMANPGHKRFVKVAPPTVHAGVGNALRQAFRLDGEMRSLNSFEDLLARLD